jgi:hypothetical protein
MAVGEQIERVLSPTVSGALRRPYKWRPRSSMLGLPILTNEVRGWRSSRYGRTPIEELIALYRRRPVRVQEPSILIRLTGLYRPQMTASELYGATRASWKVGPKRERAKYALAVFEGIVREVYEITQWSPGGSTFNSRDPRGVRASDRWEFVGRLAPERGDATLIAM